MAPYDRKHLPPRVRRLAKTPAWVPVLDIALPKGNNPSARRARRLARKGWLIGWPFMKGNL
ncbi:hypothetical protein ACEPPZ_14510 [Paracoccus yeei]|jgi:hypothetical protein|uniref:hypothetical protein n=1 Tax=Paracoccus yeei TaxID=147645 RepID=UPI0028D3638F|nr:hypothetical protein [Paracoccus yeei]